MSGAYIVRSIPRAEPAALEQLAIAGVATVHEAQGRSGLLDHNIVARQRGVRIAGSAVTVSTAPGDNLMLHAAVEVIEPGDMVVVTLTSPGIHGMFGDLLAASMRARGCVGLVTDSAVRDIAELNEMGFPVWTRAIHAEGTVKETSGSVNMPVVFGDVPIAPGDVVVADEDGVVIVERTAAVEVAEAAAGRIEKEEAMRTRLESGELGLDIYGLRQKLTDLGASWVDSANDL